MEYTVDNALLVLSHARGRGPGDDVRLTKFDVDFIAMVLSRLIQRRRRRAIGEEGGVSSGEGGERKG